ncbi:MAG: (deoxy)nucleoside triphosphate pyrophosphohydrolase [Acholeplasmataceae bacterium]
MKKIIEVVAAIIIKDKKVFTAQRKDEGELAKKWEFPGGKIEKNETQEMALKRELKEELNINISNIKYFMTVNHEYESFKLILHSYKCSIESKNINLNEHLNSKWLSFNDLDKVDWAAADLPIVKKLKDLNG